MVKQTILCLAVVTGIMMIFSPACTNDQLPEPTEPMGCLDSIPTYDGSIKAIIDNSCAYAGCHLGGAPGIYDTYAGLEAALSGGLFRERVILERDDPGVGMPPNYAPEGRPEDLTAEELELITCWLDNGFPEN